MTGRGAREIDATGRYVSPGWIDMMDQSASILTRNGLAENKVMMGVTTALSGEGGTPVPPTQVASWFAGLEKSGISLNFGDYYSATDAREAVLGMQDRAPTPAELERMKAMVDTAMRAGTLGITTALIYPPSSYHRTEELIELAKVASKYGGFYASHIRGEGKELVQSVGEAIRIGEEGGVPVEIYHLKAAYQPGWGKLMNEAGALVDAARARGRGRGRGPLPLHCGRHRARGDDPVVGVRGRVRLAPEPAHRSRHPRAAQEGSGDGLTGLVEHHRGRGRLGRRGDGERAESRTTRSGRTSRSPRSRRRWTRIRGTWPGTSCCRARAGSWPSTT